MKKCPICDKELEVFFNNYEPYCSQNCKKRAEIIRGTPSKRRVSISDPLTGILGNSKKEIISGLKFTLFLFVFLLLFVYAYVYVAGLSNSSPSRTFQEEMMGTPNDSLTHFSNSFMEFDYIKYSDLTVIIFDDTGHQNINGTKVSIIRESNEAIWIECLDANTSPEKTDQSIEKAIQKNNWFEVFLNYPSKINYSTSNFDYSKGRITKNDATGFGAKFYFFNLGKFCRIDVFAKAQQMENSLVKLVLSTLKAK